MVSARTLLLFGATGDLAQRMLLPSLFGLWADRLIGADFEIVGTARSNETDEEFRALAAAALERHLPAERRDAGEIGRFLERLRYVPLDLSDPAAFDALPRALGDRAAEPVAIFLSTAPSLFEPAIAGFARAGLAGGNVRLALEKPLGTDLSSSRAINDAVAAYYPEGQTFRLDHYLGKETVQNLIALRFGNALFEPLWNTGGIDHVQITVSETVGLEGRGGFYEGTGALRDMVQNHMLQLLALVAMEPPARFDAVSIRDEKVKALRSLRPIGRSDAATCSVMGQYGGGAIGGAPVPGYVEELGRDSGTETFVALKAHIDNWRWKGVPFYLRTGKRLPRRHSQIVVQFRGVPHSIFDTRGAGLTANRLVISLQPEENIRLTVMAKQPGLDRDGLRLREVPLDISLPNAFAGTRRRIAYERLLLDLIEGEQTLFVRRDEVEAQWQWIDGIRSAWAAAGTQPSLYMAGTWGPSASIALTERDGISWHE
ncbi:glucose-6-phosphate dehydrogenase [Flavisphingomonas formosensis]|uniref:glucose-6-phosphate dehydrogenase n=1 Tax=Flavisphingomonas formosensis TaxID=861534 RepID=UPI0012F931FA|nr:glucose-6-phosphate dehydrogenase [Sphingomonas formosensis]